MTLGPPVVVRPPSPRLRPADIRGTVYFPAITRMIDKVQAWLSPGAGLDAYAAFGRCPRSVVASHDLRRVLVGRVPVGQFDAAQVESELGYLRGVGFNNIRLIGSFFAWIIHNDEFRRNLATVVGICERLGLTVTYNVWSATAGRGLAQNDAWNNLLMQFSRPMPGQRFDKAFGEALAAASAVSNDQLMATSVPPRGSIWFADAYPEPGRAVLEVSGHPAGWPSLGAPRVGEDLVDGYLATVGGVLGQSPTFQSYDLFNELDVYMLLWPRLIQNAAAFVKYTYDRLTRAHPGAACTIGTTGASRLGVTMRVTRNVPQAYLSWHAYFMQSDVAKARRAFALARTSAGGKPVVLSEFYSPAHHQATGSFRELYLDHLLRYDMGGQLWSYLQTNGFDTGREVRFPVARPIDGLAVPLDPTIPLPRPPGLWRAGERIVFRNASGPIKPLAVEVDRRAVAEWLQITKTRA